MARSRETKVKRLVLHAGVQKTGSSFIQRSFRSLRKPLRKRGIVYVGRQETHKLKGRRSWAAYAKEPTKRVDRYARRFMEVVESRIAEVRKPNTLVYSNESMIGRYGPEFGDPWWPRADSAMRELIGWFDPETTEIVVYVRRQDRLLESMYLQQVSKGHDLKWDEFVERACLDTRLRFADLIAVLDKLPTVSNVRVRPFETIRSGSRFFFKDFLDVIDSADLIDEVRSFEPSNSSYTQPAYEAAMLLNPYLENWRQKTKLRETLKEVFPESKYPKPSLMSDELRADIVSRYAEENEDFFRTYLPDFPADSYSTLEIPAALSQALAEPSP